ncbi:hypothetical protein FOZ62_002528 [Perkinsus olseni]|uniref:Uncharacterized protein n=1 Tax=Perkinsus olseni TaxID=32597 RepID=A0A7J6RSI4_PEROL|nr:hypothetical protein FOZ62_002528 [Perkinsus olseni]
MGGVATTSVDLATGAEKEIRAIRCKRRRRHSAAPSGLTAAYHRSRLQSEPHGYSRCRRAPMEALRVPSTQTCTVVQPNDERPYLEACGGFLKLHKSSFGTSGRTCGDGKLDSAEPTMLAAEFVRAYVSIKGEEL